MKIMLDTNVLISALVFGGDTGRLLARLFETDHELYVSEYVDQEFKEKLEMKWSDKADRAYQIYRSMQFHFCPSTNQKLGSLRDEKDIPVLSDALYHNVDLILTGDKDFLEADLTKPMVFSPAMFCKYLEFKDKP